MALGTSENGMDAAGDIFVQANGRVTQIDRGTNSVSYGPVLTLEPAVVTSMVSALRRLAARLKLLLVRVEGSKKRLTTTLPFRSLRFLQSR